MILRLFIYSLFILYGSSALFAESFTTKHGLEIRGIVNQVDEDRVQFILETGKYYWVHRIKFTEEEWKKISDSTPTFKVKKLHANQGWDRKITINDVPYKTIGSEDSFVYQSQLFTITAEKPIQRKAAQRLFNTAHLTFTALQEMPLPLIYTNHHGKRFNIKIIDNYREYVKITGAKNSGGVYVPATRTVYIPIRTTGLLRAPDGYFFGEYANLSIFVHEVTHQITLEETWLLTVPTWIQEGLAQHMEYHFDGDRTIDWQSFSLKKNLFKTNNPQVHLIGLETFLYDTQRSWHSDFENGNQKAVRENYLSAFLYFYFYSHLIYNQYRKSSPMEEYLLEVRNGTIASSSQKYFIFNNSYLAIENAIESIFKKEEGVDIAYIRK